MTYLKNLINPPPTTGGIQDHYQFFNSILDSLTGLTSIANNSILTNSNFNTLSAKGLNPTTQADGDNTEFIGSWFIVGATAATYSITPTVYPANSTVKSSSLHYVHAVVASHNGGPLYFYERQTDLVRKYQKDNFTYGLSIKNNQSKAIKLRMDIVNFYDPSTNVKQGNTFFLQPGINNLTSMIETDSLNGITVNSSNYTEFRFNFLDLIDGTANIELYLIKCEFGQISTPHL